MSSVASTSTFPPALTWATVAALGLGDQLVGRSHECDHPAWVKRLPALSLPAFDITGTKGALRFDAEDQNALWFYDARLRRGRQGFAKLLTAPEHPDFGAFCEGAGHGTGYGAQIIIEARDFLKAIESRETIFPTFQDGLNVSRVIAAAFRSHLESRWVRMAEI